MRADIEDHVRDEHSTFTWLLEPTMQRADFHMEDRSVSAGQVFAEHIARPV